MLRSSSTQRSITDMEAKLVEFNQRHYPNHPASVNRWPRFVSMRVEDAGLGIVTKEVSEHKNARLFFLQFQLLAQSTLIGYRWQIAQIYAEHSYGPVPWDETSGHNEATYTKKFIDKLISEARAPQAHTPIDHEVFVQLVQFWSNRGSLSLKQRTATPTSQVQLNRSVSGSVMAAAACFMRGTAGRPQDLVRLRYDYIVDRAPNGFDFFFPSTDPATGGKFTRKGRSDAESRHLVMPECLDDGLMIAEVFRSYLGFAPKTGPLFQKTTPVGGWSGKPWTSSTITEKLRKAMAEVSLDLRLPADQILKYSAHSFRSTTATSMAVGGVTPSLVAKTLNHKGSGVTCKHYIAPTKGHLRKQLTVTGAKSNSGL